MKNSQHTSNLPWHHYHQSANRIQGWRDGLQKQAIKSYKLMSKRRLLNQATYAQGIAESSAPLPELKVWDISVKDLGGEPADLADLSELGPFSAWGLVQPLQQEKGEKSRIRIFPILEYSLDYPPNAACTVWIRTHDTWYHIQTVAKGYFKIWKKMLICTNLLGFIVHHLFKSTGADESKFERVIDKVAVSLQQDASVTFDQLVRHSDFIFFQLQQQSASQVAKSDFLATLSLLLTGSSMQPLTSMEAREKIRQKRQNPSLSENIGLLKRRAKRSNIVIELDSDSDLDSPLYEHSKVTQKDVVIRRIKWEGNEYPSIYNILTIESIIANGSFQCVACPMTIVRAEGQSDANFVQRIQTHLNFYHELNQPIDKNICNGKYVTNSTGCSLSNSFEGIKWNFSPPASLAPPARLSIASNLIPESVEWESTGIIPQQKTILVLNEINNTTVDDKSVSDTEYDGLKLAMDDSD